VVRAQIADPDWAGKSAAEQAAEIRKCIACNQYCIGLMGLNAPLSCIQNPANGSEARLGEESYRAAARPKRVWVIGAGPAGMEAAIVAAHHGHRVTLFERDERLGGAVNWIVKVPARLEYGDLIRNKTSELRRYGVELRLGRAVEPADVLGAGPDAAPQAVVLATGQDETRPAHIPGMDGPRVRTPIEVLAGPRPAPPAVRHALIVDDIGFHQATSLAEYLAEGGCRVSLVTSAFAVGQQLGVTLDLELWHGRMGRLPEGALRLYAGHIVLDVRADPVLLDIYANTQTTLSGVDLIVPVQHGRPRDALYRALEGRVPELYRVGDALAPKDVGEAILDGHRAARRLSGLALDWE
jgi:Pyridine nucleotide-disulphide oxidoreductase